MFCHVPFTNLHIFETGDVYFCCPGWLPTPIGNLLNSSIEEIWRGPIAEEIRKSILDKNFRFCTNCAYLPETRGPVTDQPPAWVVEKMGVTKSLAGAVRTLLLDYDLTCNLACPSCRVGFIPKPFERSVRLHEIVLSSGIIQEVDFLRLSGSCDPFVSPLYWELLKGLPDLNPRVRVFLLTNGLLFDEKHWSELGATRDQVASVSVSVDAATPETYKLNRGGSWSRLWCNIDFIQGLRLGLKTSEGLRLGSKVLQGCPIDFSLNYVVQSNNFRELVAFTQLAFGHGVDSINVHFLLNWGTFSEVSYRERAVHLPGHPDHAEFCAVFADERIARDKRVVLPILTTG